MNLKSSPMHRYRLLGAQVFFLCTTMALDMSASRADLTLNWTPDAATVSSLGSDFPVVRCNFPGFANVGSCAGSGGDREIAFTNADTTPFAQEFVSVAGVRYYHVIVGDGRTDAFAQEVYIRAGGQVLADGVETSSSGGRAITDVTRRDCAIGLAITDACGNGLDPLRNAAAAFTGNGSGNPERVIMRQVVKDGALVDTFEKNSFTQKPKITQTLTDANLAAVFSMDMSNSDYKASTTGDNAARGITTNTLTLINPGIPAANAGNFDMATSPVQNSVKNVTGGLYTWAPGPDANFGNSSGTYTYSDGNVDLNAMRWQDFKN